MVVLAPQHTDKTGVARVHWFFCSKGAPQTQVPSDCGRPGNATASVLLDGMPADSLHLPSSEPNLHVSVRVPPPASSRLAADVLSVVAEVAVCRQR